VNSDTAPSFWSEAFAWRGSITPRVLLTVAAFGVVAAVVSAAAWLLERHWGVRIALEIAPYELAGAALGLLLILRTNAGYDRWWEARKLWGGIVNQSRNMTLGALAYGPADPDWRAAFVRWASAFPHIACCSLRGQPPSPAVAELLGAEDAARLAASGHMPSAVAARLADLLREGCERFGVDRFAFLAIDRERAALIDHIGACERILKTPLPRVYAIKGAAIHRHLPPHAPLRTPAPPRLRLDDPVHHRARGVSPPRARPDRRRTPESVLDGEPESLAPRRTGRDHRRQPRGLRRGRVPRVSAGPLTPASVSPSLPTA